MKTQFAFILLICFGYALLSCSEDMPKKTKDFTPEVEDYEFYIEGNLDNKLLRYQQIDFESTNVSNKYFIDDKETWLQAYPDSSAENIGYWKIRFHDLDIKNVTLPHVLLESQGGITWYDQRIDAIIESNSKCQGPDAGCTFGLASGEGSIVLTSNENNILEGEFSGNAFLIGFGMVPFSDTTMFHEVVNGKFKIKYREE
ncbi:MAG: hypothetical protein H7X99_06515 [Saprospiraceae bacterium]|nr:hypothetical protein [Saprospiraceae bacterium]